MSRIDTRNNSYRRQNSKAVNEYLYEIIRARNKQAQRKKYLKIFLCISLCILFFLIGYAFIMYNGSVDGRKSLYPKKCSRKSRSLSELVLANYPSSNYAFSNYASANYSSSNYPSSKMDDLKRHENNCSSSNKAVDEEGICKDTFGNALDVPKYENDSFHRDYHKSMFDIKNIKLEEISLPLSKLELSHIISRLNKDVPKEYLMNLWLQAFAVSNDLVDIVNLLNEYIQYYKNQVDKCIELTSNGNYSCWKNCNVELAQALLFEHIEYKTKFYKVLITRHM
ncbi:hypothetical protein CYL21_2218 [Plasmodium falciparum NF54]|uniref:Uncharacterized protein n=3 Tax=Plasmodium falciparum TaxID=5833 RepID=Q8IK62_PLAF7|nr:Plasmodium exported protein (PHIST), unknown function [Plasmodium falciparum 3D7]EWC85269.1 hypothetical protein PFNF54_05917 [Plasmodium falciparum NF54]KAF4329062.1 hypothetical protein CYL21_2218 [Plasmodium falciparum NF54]PKC49424.1 hypothetical protein CK202_0123 [Plasmodium falciparum NF54]CZU00469.1 Plasmodium exported protein (PHIST), unknown function [Plasmodium falciparum 3D7]|eukprot:XP_001348918.2 Plasmodium exported protein (PHIST), unknown function [Plasmodium falciparum 3D7]